jgi:CheY-like chemotaxis protein
VRVKPRCRVLIVEDEAVIAMLVEDMVLDFGSEVVGPVANVTEALELLVMLCSMRQSSTSKSGSRDLPSGASASGARHPFILRPDMDHRHSRSGFMTAQRSRNLSAMAHWYKLFARSSRISRAMLRPRELNQHPRFANSLSLARCVGVGRSPLRVNVSI